MHKVIVVAFGLLFSGLSRCCVPAVVWVCGSEDDWWRKLEHHSHMSDCEEEDQTATV